MSAKKKATVASETAAAPAGTGKAKRVRGRARAEVVVTGPQSGAVPKLSEGVVLTRLYKGKKVIVKVLGQRDFEFDGKRYTSLSAIANLVSQTHTNGIAWFGLRPRGGKPARPKGKK